LSALGLGPLGIALLPGELFTETAWAVEKGSPFQQTLILGYAESSIGYVPTGRAFEEGGYEVGPGKWSFLQAGAESIICRETADLLREVREAQLAPPALSERAQDGQVCDGRALAESEAGAA
jgi:hypothetical protein